MGRHGAVLAGVGAVFAALTSTALGATVDLTGGAGSSGAINGAHFEFYDFQAAGTGILAPFVRIQRNGTEQGYNTSAASLPFDEKAGPWTHDLLFGDVGIVERDGLAYLEFVLDINESAPAQQRLLSLDRLLIFTSGFGAQNTTDLSQLGTLHFDMDAGGDSFVIMDYTLAAGSGQTDLRVLVPLSHFNGVAPGDYLYLYSQFGLNHASNAGFEEWNVVAIPEPGTLVLFALTGLALAAARRRCA